MQYDIPLILNTLQLMSDQIFPTILVNGATKEELNDPEQRAIITDDLASFMVQSFGLELDENGKIVIDFT